VAYILAGILLGPVWGVVGVTEDVELISEAGIALLLFLVGLELSIDTARQVGRAAVLAGGGQAVFTAAGGFLLARLMGFATMEATFLALAVTFSSTVVAVKLLERRGELASVHGRVTVAILLVQDLIAVIVLTLLAGAETAGRAPVARLASAFAGMAGLTVAGLLLARRVLPRFLHWLSRTQEGLFVWSLAWCFLFIVAAAVLGLSVEIGAFVAGVSLAQLPWNHELRRRVQPLASFFVAIFFVSIGVHMEPGAAGGYTGAIIVLALFVLLVKPFVLLLLLPRLGYGRRTAFLSAVTLGQVSEFSLIIAALAERAGLISAGVLSLIGVLALITIGVSAFAIGNAGALYGWLDASGLLRMMRAPPDAAAGEVHRSGHIIVVGMNTLGRMLVHQLTSQGEQVLALDTDAAKLAGLPCATLVGDTQHSAVLQEADFTTAQLLISALQIESANNILAYRCREAGVPCAIHVFDPAMADQLRRLGVDYLMDSKHDGIRQVAEELRRAGVIA
jgi:Kef-type K+ transport system membrane component KefB